MNPPIRPFWLVSLFLLLMAPVGFALGTATLIGPVRWATSALRLRGAPQAVESAAVIAIIITLVICTAVITWLLLGVISRGNTPVRWGVPLAVVVLAGGAWLLWLDTELMTSVGGSAATTEVTSAFTFGPYPDQATIEQLRNSGYTGVISLLHPAVVPFEPQLLAREQLALQRAGLPLIHLPMLPWVSGNGDSLERLTALAREGTGRYYVHCYLGKDRVMIARRIVEQHAPAGALLEGEDRRRTLENRTSLERGRLDTLSPSVIVGPYPTPEEFTSFVANGTFDHVVSLLDPEEPGDLTRLEEERAWLSRVQVNLVELPFDPPTVEREREIARTVKDLEGRVYVHAFFGSDSEKGSLPAQLFMQEFAALR